MPVSYTKTGGQGHAYQVPDYPEAADGPKAFKDYSDALDAILPPVGTVLPFVGNTAPSGWLLCDGSEYSSTLYPKLAALCATKFGSASSGNFRVPNLKGRQVTGLDSAQSEFDTVGKSGGAKSVTLTTAQMPSHTHVQDSHTHVQQSHNHTQNEHNHTQNAHQHTATTNSTGGQSGYIQNIASQSGATPIGADGTVFSVGSQNANGGNGTGKSNWPDRFNFSIPNHSHTVSIPSLTATNQAATATNQAATAVNNPTVAVNQNTGGGAAFNTVDPYLTLNHIIRAA